MDGGGAVTFTVQHHDDQFAAVGAGTVGVEQMLAALAPDVTVVAAGMTELGADEEVEW
jgi:hypothetical protein